MGTDNVGSVLEFKCGADFIHRRAEARRDGGNAAKALSLFKRASAAEPDNADYMADLAEMLNFMGFAKAAYDSIIGFINGGHMAEPSYRLLNDLVWCLIVSENYLAAKKCLDFMQKSAAIHRAAAHTSELQFQSMAKAVLSDSRKLGERVIKRMNCYYDMGDRRHAFAVARKYLKRHADAPLANAIMAWAFAMRDDQPASMEHLVKALAMTPQNPWILSIASRILAGGDRGQAQPAIQNAFLLKHDIDCDMVLLKQAAAFDMDALALEIADRILEYLPCDPRCSAFKAAAMIRTGLSHRQALKVIQSSLEIYPDNAITQHYMKLILRMKAADADVHYPDREMLEIWARTVSQSRIRFMGGAFAPEGMSDAELAAILGWGLNFSNPEISGASAALLINMEGRTARDILWQFLSAYDLPDERRYNVLYRMTAMNYPLPKLIFTDGRLQRLDARAICRMMNRLEKRKDVRIAARRLRSYPMAIATLHSMLMLSGAQARLPIMSGALELAYRRLKGQAISPRQYSKYYNLNCRQLTRTVELLLASVLPAKEELK